MIRIRLMTTADLPLAMRLKSQAGWNQLEADWRRFLEMQPDGCFIAELQGEPAGTTVTCIFNQVAWVAMVLVDTAVRGQGIGTKLMQHALELLDAQDVQSVRLDATPLGQPIYEKLGFVAEYTLARYQGVLDGVSRVPYPKEPAAVTAVETDDWGYLLALDRETSGTNRGKFLERLFRERPEAVRAYHRSGVVEGYMTVRCGSNALQLGPCLGTREAGVALLSDAAARYAGARVFLDVPTQNEPAMRLAEGLGLSIQRTLVRMCRGRLIQEHTSRLWASSGPELG